MISLISIFTDILVMYDFGYPQTFDEACIFNLISAKGFCKTTDVSVNSAITAQLTGKNTWRQQNVRHAKNTLHVDIEETISGTITNDGMSVFDISGQIMVFAKISGSPTITFKVPLLEKVKYDDPNYQISQIFYDSCVTHSNEHNGSVSLIPPDLLKTKAVAYKILMRMTVPFSLSLKYESLNLNQGRLMVSLRKNINNEILSPLKVLIPIPADALKPACTATKGHISKSSGAGIIIWKLRALGVHENADLSIELKFENPRTVTESKVATIQFEIKNTITGCYPSGIMITDNDLPHINSDTQKYIAFKTISDKYEYRYNI